MRELTLTTPVHDMLQELMQTHGAMGPRVFLMMTARIQFEWLEEVAPRFFNANQNMLRVNDSFLDQMPCQMNALCSSCLLLHAAPAVMCT